MINIATKLKAALWPRSWFLRGLTLGIGALFADFIVAVLLEVSK